MTLLMHENKYMKSDPLQFIDLSADIFVTISMLTLIFQLHLRKLFPIDFWKACYAK